MSDCKYCSVKKRIYFSPTCVGCGVREVLREKYMKRLTLDDAIEIVSYQWKQQKAFGMESQVRQRIDELQVKKEVKA